MRSLDLALHAWDLARSLELDDDLDQGLCEHLLVHGAAQLRLLRLTGRA